jgi:hypothetical protein
MSRPLLISDCDEVLLHMIVPFRDWLDEAHHIHFDLVHGDWGEALRHKHDGTVVERGQVWDLLNGFSTPKWGGSRRLTARLRRSIGCMKSPTW